MHVSEPARSLLNCRIQQGLEHILHEEKPESQSQTISFQDHTSRATISSGLQKMSRHLICRKGNHLHKWRIPETWKIKGWAFRPVMAWLDTVHIEDFRTSNFIKTIQKRLVYTLHALRKSLILRDTLQKSNC